MEGVRLFSRGTTNDHTRFVDVAKRMCAFVENREPGCRTYECFVDAGTGQVLWQEAFEDADALLAHVQGLQESGLTGVRQFRRGSRHGWSSILAERQVSSRRAVSA